MAIPTLTRSIEKNLATLTFAKQRIYPYAPGDTVTVSGLGNTLYNVTAVVLDSGLDFVQYVVTGRDELEIPDTGGSIAFVSASNTAPGRYVQVEADNKLPALDASQLTFTADDSDVWATAAPVTLQDAINRIAAVVGAETPIP
jgi:hypothetical protein